MNRPSLLRRAAGIAFIVFSLRAAVTTVVLLALASACAVSSAVPAEAQVVPLPMPPPPRPPLPTGGVQRALGGAFGAITSVTPTNPAVAQQANFLYQSALERYRAGDFAAAAAEADAARAIAGGAGTTPTPLQPNSPAVNLGTVGAGATGQYGTPAGSQVPIPPGAGSGEPGQPTTATNHPREQIAAPTLPDDLLQARNEIELAGVLDGPQLEEAKRHYRAALNAYLSGDRKTERREAGASFAQAEQVLERPPKP